MALDLITGHQGVAHISAEQISTINKAMMDGYGDNKVMRMKNGTLTQDGLTIEVATGYWRANGFDIEIQEAETVYIDPSSIGMSRIDNVYVELLQDIPTGAQRAEIVTIQGEEAASDPTAPDAPTSPYLNTDILLDVIPLASVTVTEGVMVLTDLTEDFDLVTPSELAAVEGEALAAQSAASTAQTAADNAQQAIAPIEASSTASQAYAIGEQFILNGLLTEATAAISQGDTIVVGNAGNAKLSDSVTDQLSTLKDALNDITDFTVNVPQIIGKLGSRKIYQVYLEGAMPTKASGQQAMHDLTAYLPADDNYQVFNLSGAVQQSNTSWFPANTVFDGTANQNDFHFVAWIDNKNIYIKNFYSNNDSHRYCLVLTYACN